MAYASSLSTSQLRFWQCIDLSIDYNHPTVIFGWMKMSITNRFFIIHCTCWPCSLVYVVDQSYQLSLAMASIGYLKHTTPPFNLNLNLVCQHSTIRGMIWPTNCHQGKRCFLASFGNKLGTSPRNSNDWISYIETGLPFLMARVEYHNQHNCMWDSHLVSAPV